MPKRTGILISVLLLACTAMVQAFNFEPITQNFTPEGKGSNHIFRVTNTEDERIAVKISVRPRSIEPDGTEIQGKDAEEFIIFPRQLLLNPGEGRGVRVKWTGTQAPEAELAYRIIAEQVPVSFTEEQPFEGGQIKLTYRYEGNIYIVPPGAKPKIIVKTVKREINGDSETLYLDLENTGTRHTLLRNIELKLKRDENDSSPIILTDNELKGAAGENMLAGSVRFFNVPLPEGLWEGPVYGSIKVDSAY